MKLPSYEQAVVPEQKITRYLLSESSHEGRSKAAFFASFGFSVAEWQMLARALLDHASRNEVAQTITTVHGTKYIVEGELLTPDARNPLVRTVWLIEQGETAARLITAYPVEGR